MERFVTSSLKLTVIAVKLDLDETSQEEAEAIVKCVKGDRSSLTQAQMALNSLRSDQLSKEKEGLKKQPKEEEETAWRNRSLSMSD